MATGLPRPGWRRALLMAGLGAAGLTGVAMLTVCLTSGCSSVGYLAGSVTGHLALLNSARPVDEWLARADTPDTLRTRLVLSQRMRDFAVSELALPDNRSYRSYADLKRPAAVWNVAAAPELSLSLRTWCYPVVGCVSYRGFYDPREAQAAADELRAQGLDVTVYPVSAYSTLGKAEWLGGDPLLNTFIGWSELELARLIFHELAHQVAYAPGDSMFNESFATAVEQLGGARWQAAQSGAAEPAAMRAIDRRRNEFRALTLQARQALDALYRSRLAPEAQRARKAQILADLRAEHAALKAGAWQGYAGYDAFIAHANNASLGMQATYHDWVPAFTRLFAQQGEDFPRFYAEVQRLAGLPRGEREATLRALAPPASSADGTSSTH